MSFPNSLIGNLSLKIIPFALGGFAKGFKSSGGYSIISKSISFFKAFSNSLVSAIKEGETDISIMASLGSIVESTPKFSYASNNPST